MARDQAVRILARLDLGDATTVDIARALGLPDDAVRVALARLQRLGYAAAQRIGRGRGHSTLWARGPCSLRPSATGPVPGWKLTRLKIDPDDPRLVRSVCAICGTPPSPVRRLALDHDHVTGAFRGRLCTRCNMGLGFFADDPVRLRAALKYLQAGQEAREGLPAAQDG